MQQVLIRCVVAKWAIHHKDLPKPTASLVAVRFHQVFDSVVSLTLTEPQMADAGTVQSDFIKYMLMLCPLQISKHLMLALCNQISLSTW